MPEKPYTADLRLLSILARAEAWIEPADSPSHPLSVTFYVPAHLVPDLERLLPAPPDTGPGPKSRIAHLSLLP